MQGFNAWFRATMIKPDGRVIWWEHVLAHLMVPLAIGVWVAHFFHSPWPLIVSIILGVGVGLYSYKQDVIVKRMADRTFEPSAIPLSTKVFGVIIGVLFAFIMWQTWSRGGF